MYWTQDISWNTKGILKQYQLLKVDWYHKLVHWPSTPGELNEVTHAINSKVAHIAFGGYLPIARGYAVWKSAANGNFCSKIAGSWDRWGYHKQSYSELAASKKGWINRNRIWILQQLRTKTHWHMMGHNMPISCCDFLLLFLVMIPAFFFWSLLHKTLCKQ